MDSGIRMSVQVAGMAVLCIACFVGSVCTSLLRGLVVDEFAGGIGDL